LHCVVLAWRIVARRHEVLVDWHFIRIFGVKPKFQPILARNAVTIK